MRFAETDAMGVVHHGAYIIWFEAARVAWMEAQGVPYAAFAKEGHNFAVTSVHADYRQSIRFGDGVRITTWVSEVRSRQVVFEYEIRRAQDDALAATGRTELVCVDLDGRVSKIPQKTIDGLRRGTPAS